MRTKLTVNLYLRDNKVNHGTLKELRERITNFLASQEEVFTVGIVTLVRKENYNENQSNAISTEER